MDLDHIDEAIRNMKPSRLKNGSPDKLYREMRNLCCACTETCHNRNPRASYRHKTSLINAGHERETGSDDSDNDDGSDSDSDWEEQQENLRKKRSGGGRGTKRKNTFPDSNDDSDTTEDDYLLPDDGSPCY